MRKFFLGMAFVFIVLLCIGCSERERYIVEGESEHWVAKLKVTVNEEGLTEDFVVNYKGELEELAEVNRLEYAYQTAASSGRSEINFNENPPSKKTFSQHGGSSRNAFDSTQTVDVTIKWGEHEETIALKE